MPKFPDSPADLPTILNPFDPRHYWLVFKWIFFQPSGLKLYLHQIAPELFITDTWRDRARSIRLLAFIRMYFIALVVALIITLGLIILAASLQSTPMRWTDVIASAFIGMGLGAALGIALGAAWGIVAGVIGSVTLAIAMGVTMSIALGLSTNLISGIIMGTIWGLGVAAALNGTGSTSWGTLVGLGLGSAVSLALGMVMSVARDTGAGLALGILGGAAVLAGTTRLIFYLPELVWILLWAQRKDRLRHLNQHPAVWDELAVFPLPGLQRPLIQALDDDFETGLQVAVQVAANPFQRATVQRTLSKYLLRNNILQTLIKLVHCPALDDYLAVPANRYTTSRFPSARLALLNELSQDFADGTGEANRTSEQVVWLFTRLWRDRTRTPLIEFCKMLFILLRDEATLEKEGPATLQLAHRFQSAYEGIRVYPQGDEVANSWASLTAFWEVTHLEQLGTAQEQLTWIPETPRPYLSPAIIATLTALGDVSRSVAACMQATSLPNKTVALNQAAGGLNELSTYAQTELWPPERALLGALIKHWQSLIATEQGRLGESALRQMSPSERLATGLVDRTSDVWQRPAKPLANPYIAGDPVMPPLFVGRRDIFTQIAEIWRAKQNPDSIILYGHRRMGKSSILRNLDQAAPGRAMAYVNLQGETSFVDSTAALLLALADRIYAEVKRARPDAALTQPSAEQFNTPSAAQIQFNRFMEQARAALGDSGLILALDEFEAIEEAVRDGKVGKEIYQFLRAKTQEPWITVVFGGLHTLDEMSRDYAQPFYGSYQNIVVSYLAPDDARHLITNPTPDFTVNYELAAADRIIAATGGQPYLVQLVCRDALDHLNHELFDEHQEREVKITLADVAAVLGDDLFRRGTGYFDGVWTQVSETAQQDLLRCMAQREERWTLAELEEATHHTAEVLRQHLQLAERRDIVRQRDGAWEFYVPLMRQWILWKEH